MKPRAGWPIYWDAQVAASAQARLNVELEVTNAYYDGLGHYHLVGLVHDLGDDSLSISLVAGLYAADGTVLDTATSSVPIYIRPGREVPFRYQYFSNIDNNANESKAVDTYSVRVNRSVSSTTNAHEPGFKVVELQSENENFKHEGVGVIRAVGEVINTSGQNLSHIVVAVITALSLTALARSVGGGV